MAVERDVRAFGFIARYRQRRIKVPVIHRISSTNQVVESTVFVGLIAIYPQDITN